MFRHEIVTVSASRLAVGSEFAKPTSLRRGLLPPLYKNVVGGSIPGIVYAAKKQHEDRAPHPEKCNTKVRQPQRGRSCEVRIGGERHETVKQPVLEIGPVSVLPAHAHCREKCIDCSGNPHQAANRHCRNDFVPGCPKERRDKKHGAEMYNRGRGKSGSRFCGAHGRPLGNQCHHHELQTDQCTGGRADDDVEAVPSREEICCSRPAQSLATSVNSMRLPKGSKVKTRWVSARSAFRISYPASCSRATSSARPRTANAGCALRAGRKSASTPRCTFRAPLSNQQPPRAASSAGFGTSGIPNTSR